MQIGTAAGTAPEKRCRSYQQFPITSTLSPFTSHPGSRLAPRPSVGLGSDLKLVLVHDVTWPLCLLDFHYEAVLPQ